MTDDPHSKDLTAAEQRKIQREKRLSAQLRQNIKRRKAATSKIDTDPDTATQRANDKPSGKSDL